MIKINKSETADTRTCDWSKVTEEQLMVASVSHISDVTQGMKFFMDKLANAAINHDPDKLEDIKGFHHDFQTGFKETTWWDKHRKINRHHIDKEDGIPEDVNLVDVIEHITDCVMAGMGRRGSAYVLKLPDELLQRAFKNTVDLLKANVEVKETEV